MRRLASSPTAVVLIGAVIALDVGCSSEEPAPARARPTRPAAPADDTVAPSDPAPIVLKGSKAADAPAGKDSPAEQERIARLKASADASQGRHESGDPVRFKAPSPSATGPAKGRVKGSTEWTDSLAAARERARAENKAVLLDFTGSDWCGWCHKLGREVFDTPQFKDWASENVVLVEVDFPRQKAQSDELKAQNAALQNQLQVRGYPTIVFEDAAGKVLGNVGYLEGGPDVWLKSAQAIVDKLGKP